MCLGYTIHNTDPERSHLIQIVLINEYTRDYQGFFFSHFDIWKLERIRDGLLLDLIEKDF